MKSKILETISSRVTNQVMSKLEALRAKEKKPRIFDLTWFE
jgi:hypothetical protein